MKTAILTGSTGFLGHWLLKELMENNVFVYALCRKNSGRISRLSGYKNIKVIDINMEDISMLPEHIDCADNFYHLAWEGERNDFISQTKNIENSIFAMQAAKKIGVKHFTMTGSQAEYGICNDRVDENHSTNPNTAYGVCKLSTYLILKVLSAQLILPFSWVRVFSIYGDDDSQNKLLISYIVDCFKKNKKPELTTCEQLWDFLYAKDAANALYLIGEQEKNGIYNLGYGESRKLKDYIIEARNILNPNIRLTFGSNKNFNGVELNVNVDKLKKETGWNPKTSFKDGILKFKR
ncbi:MAG: NAD(P)-dependent oxidoreductase [Smithella sp.]|jgi:nucleoside-diphosphate-sugar epimerase